MFSFYVDKFDSYPPELLSVLNDFSSTLKKYVRECERNDMEYYALPMDAAAFNQPDLFDLKEKMCDVLFGNKIHAYHNTCVLETTDILENGLETLNANSYRQRMADILEHSPYREEKSDLLELLQPFLSNKIGQRTGLLAFYVSEMQYNSYSKYARNIGGEVAEFAFEPSRPEVLEFLRERGKPIVVEFLISIETISESKLEALLAEICRKYICKLNMDADYSVIYDGRTEIAIPPSDVFRIIEVKEYDQRKDEAIIRR